MEKRDHVIKELLDTEKNYVDVLKTLKFQFMKPLSNMLKQEVLNIIFKDIPVSVESALVSTLVRGLCSAPRNMTSVTR